MTERKSSLRSAANGCLFVFGLLMVASFAIGVIDGLRQDGVFDGWLDSAQSVVAPVDDSDDLWLMAMKNFHNDQMGIGDGALADGCPWKYKIDPDTGTSYIIERATRVRRYRNGSGGDWPTEVEPEKPPLASLFIVCGHQSKQSGLEFGMRITRVGNHRATLPKGTVPVLLDHSGPLPASGFTSPTGGLAVPGAIAGEDGRLVTMRPTQEMIRGFQGAYSLTAGVLLDDGTVIWAIFDLKHSRAHSETIYEECMQR